MIVIDGRYFDFSCYFHAYFKVLKICYVSVFYRAAQRSALRTLGSEKSERYP